jgi:hypothetical protein
MRKPILLVAILVVFLVTPARADDCIFVIMNTLNITWTDDNGTLVESSTRYYFGWLCFGNAGDYYIPIPDIQEAATSPPTGSGGCTVAGCQNTCDAEYDNTVQGEFYDTEAAGYTWRPCGVICVETATANRDACYGECASDCNP